MTDQTTIEREKSGGTVPCEKCGKTTHTTDGHFEGSDEPMSPNGHFEGSSVPTEQK